MILALMFYLLATDEDCRCNKSVGDGSLGANPVDISGRDSKGTGTQRR